ncbi:MAG: hypothetical protein KC636_08925, partial [Myxococcales bacterium]|nr:hypothetical protein [Myxococcales bacterium]
AWHMGWAPALAAAGDDWQAPFLARLLNDPYAAVRRIAAASLRRLPGFDALEYDHVGAPGARAAAPAMVSDRWRALGTSRDDPALLLPGGALDLAGVGRLVADRDQREVTLAE